jgi:hypothetical protein
MTNPTPIIFESQAALVSALNNKGTGDNFHDLLKAHGHIDSEGLSVGLKPSSDLVIITEQETKYGVVAKYAATMYGKPVVIQVIKLSGHLDFSPTIRQDGSYTSPATIDNLGEIANAKDYLITDLSDRFSGNPDHDLRSDTALGYVKKAGSTTYLVTLEGR